jgi:TonB family protein
MGVSRALAPLLSLGIHGGLVLVLWLLGLVPRDDQPGRKPAQPLVEVAISLVPPPLPLGKPPTPVLAAGDLAGTTGGGAVAALALPGEALAARGGGADEELAAWTGRRDHESMKMQSWSHPDEYRQLRVRTSRRRSSDDAAVRLPDPGEAAQARRLAQLARTGEVGPSRDVGPLVAGALPEVGAAVSRRERADAKEGPRATETPVDGPTRENLDSARASDERLPGAFDMTPPAVSGPQAPGVSPEAAGRGTAAFRGEGDGDAARRGQADDPYLRRLVARVLDRVVFPPELALSLEQGEVIVEFLLRRDGSIAEVKVVRPSGQKRFDGAILAALPKAAPFGPVPEGLLRGKPAVRVQAPFAFDNPVIR